jgi:hypothetical protein
MKNGTMASGLTMATSVTSGLIRSIEVLMLTVLRSRRPGLMVV